MLVLLSRAKNSLSARLEMQLEDGVNFLRAKNITIRGTIVKHDKENDDSSTIEEMLGEPVYGSPLVN